jgi:hypothetical protein
MMLAATTRIVEMFVRFRRQVHRLNVSVVASRREAGKVRCEHIAALGSIEVREQDAEPGRVLSRLEGAA